MKHQLIRSLCSIAILLYGTHPAAFSQTAAAANSIKAKALEDSLDVFLIQAAYCLMSHPDTKDAILQKRTDEVFNTLGGQAGQIFLDAPARKRLIDDAISSASKGATSSDSFMFAPKEACANIKIATPSEKEAAALRATMEERILFASVLHERCQAIFPGQALYVKPTDDEASKIRFGNSAAGRKANADFLNNPPRDILEKTRERVRQIGYASWERICIPLQDAAPRNPNPKSLSRSVPVGQTACLLATYTPYTKDMRAAGRYAPSKMAHLDLSLDAITRIDSITGTIWGLDQDGKSTELLIDANHAWTIPGRLPLDNAPFDGARDSKLIAENGQGSIALHFGTTPHNTTRLFPGKLQLPAGPADLTFSHFGHFIGKESLGKPSFIQMKDFSFKICGPSTGKDSVWLVD